MSLFGAGQQCPHSRGQGTEWCVGHQRRGRKGGRSSPGGSQEQEGQTQHQPLPSRVIYVTERFPLRGLRQNPAQEHHTHVPCAQALSSMCWEQKVRDSSSLPGLRTSPLPLQMLWGLPPLGLPLTRIYEHHWTPHQGIQPPLQPPVKAPSEHYLFPHAPVSL